MSVEPSFVLDGKGVCLVMGYTLDNPKYAVAGAVSKEINLEYCKSKGYAARIYTSGFATDRHPSWSKILFVRDSLKYHSWVFWIDADAVVTNPSVGLEQFVDDRYMLVVGKQNWKLPPWNSINFGVFLARSSPEMEGFFDKVWSDIGREGRVGWEQDGVRRFMCEEEYKPKVNVVCRRNFNSVVPHESLMLDGSFDHETEAWHKGDFVAHFGYRREDLAEVMMDFGKIWRWNEDCFGMQRS